MSSDGAIATLAVTVVFLGYLVFSLNRSLARLREAKEVIQTRLDAVVIDRDGWRDMARRAVFVAELAPEVTKRAVSLAEELVESKHD